MTIGRKMRKSLLYKVIVLIMCGCIGVTSCTVSTPAKQTAVVPDAIVTATIRSAATVTSSIDPTVIPTQPLQPTITAALLPTPTAVSAEIVSRTCTISPQRFNFRQSLNMNELSYLRFENENSLIFEGRTNRPEPIVTPVTPDPTPEIRPDPFASYRILITGGQLNLLDGKFTSRPLEVGSPLGNPCGEDCPMEVISQSPNGKWQVIQVSDWVREKEGYWLVSENEMVHLVPYVTGAELRWSDDSSLLWLVTSYPNDIGGYTLLIQLGDSVSIKESERGSWLDPLFYFYAFSPLDRMLILMPSYEHGFSRTEELFQIDLAEYPVQATKVRDVPGIVAVSWNVPTQSFLIQIVKEEMVEFQDLSGNTLVTIPFSTLESVIPALADENGSLLTGLGRNYTLSESGKRLALVHSPGEIWVFYCE